MPLQPQSTFPRKGTNVPAQIERNGSFEPITYNAVGDLDPQGIRIHNFPLVFGDGKILAVAQMEVYNGRNGRGGNEPSPADVVIRITPFHNGKKDLKETTEEAQKSLIMLLKHSGLNVRPLLNEDGDIYLEARRPDLQAATHAPVHAGEVMLTLARNDFIHEDLAFASLDPEPHNPEFTTYIKRYEELQEQDAERARQRNADARSNARALGLDFDDFTVPLHGAQEVTVKSMVLDDELSDGKLKAIVRVKLAKNEAGEKSTPEAVAALRGRMMRAITVADFDTHATLDATAGMDIEFEVTGTDGKKINSEQLIRALNKHPILSPESIRDVIQKKRVRNAGLSASDPVGQSR